MQVWLPGRAAANHENVRVAFADAGDAQAGLVAVTLTAEALRAWLATGIWSS